MRTHFDTATQRFLVALATSATLVTLFLRYLWSLSLGNGDELFFSTGAGAFNVPDGSWAQWGGFFSWLWWEHTGRTADWLSGLVYFFGDEEGRWIVSALTTVSAASIILCVYLLYRRFAAVPQSTWIVAPISIGAMLFAYSVLTLNPFANLTMYSAAVCNYLVPTALIFVSVTLVTVSKSRSSLYMAAILAAVTATMHEQAAAVLAVLVLVFVLYGPKDFSLSHRLFSAAIVLVGVVEMFLAPGLHAKLTRVAAVSPEVSVPLAQKVLTTFYGFGVYFPLLGLFISIVVAVYLLFYIQSEEKRALALSCLIVLTVSTALWFFSIVAFFLKLSIASMTFSGLSCMVMMTVWLCTPLISTSLHVRWGALFLLCAAVSLGIPAAAGLAAVRVYNYPLIFFFAFLTWSALIALTHLSTAPRRSTTILLSTMFAVLPLMSAWVMGYAVIAFKANYDPGVKDLERQESICSQEICPASDPALPYQTALSGYGEHDYASVDAVLEWLEK